MPGVIDVKANLSFTEDGKKIFGFTLISENPNAEKILVDIMDGRIKGLEYCEEKRIKMVAGGGDAYCFMIFK